ncbi:MAG TPA: hypothetical protein VMH80_26105 [Bryobacteraceae bacterium]|nr:hypothetical protein [Bryobacteraceae bacterium]
MKALKEAIRFVCKILGGLAGGVLFLAPFTNAGLLAMTASVVVGLICFAGYLWSEPDEPPSDSDLS